MSDVTKYVYLTTNGVTKEYRVTYDIQDVEKLYGLELRIMTAGGRSVSVYAGLTPLGELVIGKKEGFIVDHIDRDPLNNRRNNLRHLTEAQNKANVGITKQNKSGYKGVYWRKNMQSYSVAWTVSGETFHKHGFNTALEAALYYDDQIKQSALAHIKPTNASLGLLPCLSVKPSSSNTEE